MKVLGYGGLPMSRIVLACSFSHCSSSSIDCWMSDKMQLFDAMLA